MINIDLLSYKNLLKIKTKNGKTYIFDSIRKKYLVLQPEELVRQLTVKYLIKEKNYNKNRIALEKTIKVNDLKKRFDILVYDKKMLPALMVECKAPQKKINQKSFEQISWYNMPLKVKFLVVTNGIETFCCELDYLTNSYTFLKEIPDYSIF